MTEFLVPKKDMHTKSYCIRHLEECLAAQVPQMPQVPQQSLALKVCKDGLFYAVEK